MPNHDDGLEKLRERSETSLIPELRKVMLHASKEARKIARDMRDQIGKFNVTNPARRNPGVVETFVIRDKSGTSYQFIADSNGRDWGVSGYNILPVLNILHSPLLTEQELSTACSKAFGQKAGHNHFYKRLIEIHPLIGAATVLARTQLPGILARHPSRLESKDYAEFNPEKWYEVHLTTAEKALFSINKVFALLSERCNDEITRSFLHDCKRECELLIMECCHFSFLLLEHFLGKLSRNQCVIPCVVKDTSLAISPQEYLLREKEILRLRSAYVEYYNQSRLIDVFPMPDRQKVIENGEVRLPVFASIYDIEALLQHYSNLWEQLSSALQKNKSFPFNKGYAKIVNACEIGIQHDSAHSQDRLSFILPGFNIRFDKDSRHGSITLDVGGISLAHALACAEEYLGTVQVDKKLPTVFKGVSDEINPQIKLENKIALVASMMMGSSRAVGLRKKPTISHHSREFVAKDEYYNNYSHILACIKGGLERPGQ
ncbi:MAG: hypothetical protein AAB400_02945 [Patescibacteria group bacterium]